MALTINTNIKNDADGYLLDAESVKVDEENMLDDVLESMDEKIDNSVPKTDYVTVTATLKDLSTKVYTFYGHEVVE